MSWLDQIRTADEGTKNKIVIAITVLAATAIILVWLLVFGGPRPLPSAQQAVEEKGFSAWGSIRGGTASVWNNFFGREENIKP